MVTKFYSFWVDIASEEANDNMSARDVREYNNVAAEEMKNELNTVLGNNELISMTSSATNGIVITTIAYESHEEDSVL